MIARFAGDLARLWPEGDKLGLAVSGGPDSLALLLLARAAIQTPEGKAAAWAAMFDATELTNAQLESHVRGFARVLDPALLAPYVEPYFARIEAVWSERSFALAEPIALSAYPRAVADETLATAARTWLDTHPDAAAPLRRIVAENLSRTDRALVAQARDRV